jgi:hypothetical protein
MGGERIKYWKALLGECFVVFSPSPHRGKDISSAEIPYGINDRLKKTGKFPRGAF